MNMRAFLLGEVAIDQWQAPVKIIIVSSSREELLQTIELTRGSDGLISRARIAYHNGDVEHAPPFDFIIWDAADQAVTLSGDVANPS